MNGCRTPPPAPLLVKISAKILDPSHEIIGLHQLGPMWYFARPPRQIDWVYTDRTPQQQRSHAVMREIQRAGMIRAHAELAGV